MTFARANDFYVKCSYVDVLSNDGPHIFSSWGSGANPWGPEKEDQFAKPTHYDGMLEVVGVTGVVHMGQIQSGLRSAIRIAQGGHVSMLFVPTPE